MKAYPTETKDVLLESLRVLRAAAISCLLTGRPKTGNYLLSTVQELEIKADAIEALDVTPKPLRHRLLNQGVLVQRFGSRKEAKDALEALPPDVRIFHRIVSR